MTQAQKQKTRTLTVDKIQSQYSMKQYLMTQTHLIQGNISISYHKEDRAFNRPILGVDGPLGLPYTLIPTQEFSQQTRSGLKPGKFPFIESVFNKLPQTHYSAYAEWRNLVTLWQKGLDSRDWLISNWQVKSHTVLLSSPNPVSLPWMRQLYFLII